MPDSPEEEHVDRGESGVWRGLRKGTLCIDKSTIAPATAKGIAHEGHANAGAFLDEPISGRKTRGRAGTLAVMVGGTADEVARARPLFDVVGESVVHCDPAGVGQLTKLCNQILRGLNLLGVSEAITLAKRVGLDPEKMLQAVARGAAGFRALDNLGPRMIKHDFKPMLMVDLQHEGSGHHFVDGSRRRRVASWHFDG